MNTKEIHELIKAMESVYSQLNEFASKGTMQLIDYVYPNHDGKANAEAGADLYELRQSLYSLGRVCELNIEQMEEIISGFENE